MQATRALSPLPEPPDSCTQEKRNGEPNSSKARGTGPGGVEGGVGEEEGEQTERQGVTWPTAWKQRGGPRGGGGL